MKDKMMRAMTKLACCPGKCDPQNPDEICTICPHMGELSCEEHLRESALELLREYKLQKAREPQVESSNKNSLKMRVTQVMHEIGVPANLKGHAYLRHAIMLSVEDPHVLDSITKELYPKVAQFFETTPSRVERVLRHAIEVAWDRGDLATLERWFGATISQLRGKPTNSEFISLIADKLRMELEKEVQ